jgi:hypothetical protein
MATVRVRYIVNDVKAAIVFYSDHLGFKLDDLDAIVNVLRKAGARFRNNIVTGVSRSRSSLKILRETRLSSSSQSSRRLASSETDC